MNWLAKVLSSLGVFGAQPARPAGATKRKRHRNASIENPRVSLADPEAWKELFGDDETDAGVAVNPETVMGYPPFWRGVSLISATVAKVPLVVYKREGENGKRRATDHPAYRLLKKKPNRFVKAFDFKRTLTYHALLHGNGYAAIFRDGADRPVELLILDPQTTVPVQVRGQLRYLVSAGNQERSLAAREILHIKGLSFDGLVGLDVVEVMGPALGLGMAARKYGARFFGKGLTAGGVLMIPRSMPEPAAARLVQDWDKFQAGLDNSFKTAVLEEGVKWQQTSISPEQAQALQTRQFENKEVANILGLPPHKLGDQSKSSYNSLEQENQAFLDDAIDPHFCGWEEECSDKLLTEEENVLDSHYCEFNRLALARTDTKTETESLTNEVNNGLLSPDEARAIRNRPPLPDGIGQKFRMPLNIGIVDAGGVVAPVAPVEPVEEPTTDDGKSEQKGTKETKAEGALGTALKKLLADRLERLQAVECAQARRAAQKPGGFVQAIDKLYADQVGRLEESLGPVLAAIGAAAGSDQDVAVWAAGLAKGICERGKAELLCAAEVPACDLAASVDRVLADWQVQAVPELVDAVFEEIRTEK